MLYVFSVLWLGVNMYPLFFTLISSFKNNDEIYTSMFALPQNFRFENYTKAFFDSNIGEALFNSILISASATLLVLLVASMGAFVLARYDFTFTRYIELFFVVGILIPIYSLLVPIASLVYDLGGTNNYLMIITVYIALNLSISIFLITGLMKGINRSLEEAAIIDGCNSLTLFRKIIIPMSMPAIATAGIISFLNIYNELFFAVVLISDRAMYTIPMALLDFQGMYVTNLGQTFAAVIMSIAPMIIVYLLFQEKVESGLAGGSVKG